MGAPRRMTEDQVREIRARYRRGSAGDARMAESIASLAVAFGTSEQAIRKIVKRQVWKNLTEEASP